MLRQMKWFFGAEFSLIANRDIYNVNGEVIVKARNSIRKSDIITNR